MIALVSLLLAVFAAYADAACLTTCAAISAHTVKVALGDHDYHVFTTPECDALMIELSDKDSATFGFVIEDSLWHLDSVFSDSSIQFMAQENATSDAKVKISIEEQGTEHNCSGNGTFSVDNETSVMWDIPAFVEGETYSTPDLSELLNSLTVCPTHVVFEFTSFFGNGTAEGIRKVYSFEGNVNATALTLNAACPAVTGTTGAAATTDEETTGLTEAQAIGLGVGLGALGFCICLAFVVYAVMM